MRKVIQINIYKGQEHFIAEGINVPIVTQGKNYDDLMANLIEAINLFLEDGDLSAYDLESHPAIIANFELSNMIYANS